MGDGVGIGSAEEWVAGADAAVVTGCIEHCAFNQAAARGQRCVVRESEVGGDHYGSESYSESVRRVDG